MLHKIEKWIEKNLKCLFIFLNVKAVALKVLGQGSLKSRTFLLLEVSSLLTEGTSEKDVKAWLSKSNYY